MKKARNIFLQFVPELALIGLSYPLGELAGLGFQQMLLVTLLLIFQNASFTIVSRARQSSNLLLHAIAAAFSNGFFIFVITTYAANYSNLPLKFWYIVCTVVGSVHAHHLALHKIEKSKAFKKDSLVTAGEFQAGMEKCEKNLKAFGERLEVLEQPKKAPEKTPISVPLPLSLARPRRANARTKRWMLRQLGQLELGFNN